MLRRFDTSEGDRARYAAALDTPRELLELAPALQTPFVLFVATRLDAASDAEWVTVAEALLRSGAVYVVCWGPGCRDLETHFDSAYVQGVLARPSSADGAESVVMTTSHYEDTLEEALWFAVHNAWPAPAYEHKCQTVVATSIANVEWHRRIVEYLDAGAPFVDAV